MTKPGLPSAFCCVEPLPAWPHFRIPTPTPSPCPAPLTEGEHELSSWMPMVPLGRIIPNPYFAFFCLKRYAGRKKIPNKAATQSRVSSKRTRERDRAHSQMLGFLLIQPVTSSMGRGTNGNQQPRCQNPGRKSCCHHGDQSSGNSPILHTRDDRGEQIIFRH